MAKGSVTGNERVVDDHAVPAVPFALILMTALLLRRYMRSVADFLAASRCAGRYLISTAMAETGASVMVMIVALEVFSRVGWSLKYWEAFTGIILFFMGLLGIVSYRFRQTRALTFHQFFEIRYSRRFRVFAQQLLVGIYSAGVHHIHLYDDPNGEPEASFPLPVLRLNPLTGTSSNN